MLSAVLIKLGLVAESVGEEEGCLDAQFLFQPPLCCNAIGLSSARMAAAGVGPEVGPQWFVTAALLEQYLSAGVEQKDRKRAMQGASALVQFYLTTVTQDLILSIYNDEWLMIEGDDIAGRIDFW